MVWEILIRLPVKSLTRFKQVSKAWHAIISDPLLVRAHLHCSKHTQRRVPSSFLIAPRVFLQSDVPYTPISTDIRFYHWSLPLQQQESATLLYQRHFPPGEFTLGAPMAHCDGLVLLPSDTNVYVFNPAIRDVVALPESRRNVIQYPTCLPVGLGLDPSTGKYKVARSFYRHCDDYGHVTMGMEVFTISSGRDQDDGWKETSEDPPALVAYQQTAVQCKGYLFYFIDKVN
uniref:F-box domain-containing protein n=1 Tax=Triticum urartu TaxID=4572 RepID=A0A8R7U404_TRIUA